jgi:hypothetical protein
MVDIETSTWDLVEGGGGVGYMVRSRECFSWVAVGFLRFLAIVTK